MKLLFLIALSEMALSAGDAEAIRAVLLEFNGTVRKSESQPLRGFFTAEADYRDGTRVLKGAGALASLLTDRQVWSERTPPMLQNESIRLVGSSAAIVDAQLIQYGTTIVKSGSHVVLLVEKEEGSWKISSWRMAGCPISLTIQ